VSPGPEGILDRHPELLLLHVAVPVAIQDTVRYLAEDRRLALAAECGQYIAEHGDDLMFRGRKGAAAKAFTMLAHGLACAAFQPGGIDFAGMHFCADHGACTGADGGPPQPAPVCKRLTDTIRAREELL
jgi:hypothetical protein